MMRIVLFSQTSKTILMASDESEGKKDEKD